MLEAGALEDVQRFGNGADNRTVVQVEEGAEQDGPPGARLEEHPAPWCTSKADIGHAAGDLPD